MVKINTIAAFNVANLVALKMVQTKNRKKIGGAIVNMSSQMGHVGGPISHLGTSLGHPGELLEPH